MTDEQIEHQRIQGEISLALETASPEERAGLLHVIASITTQERSDELDKQFPPQ